MCIRDPVCISLRAASQSQVRSGTFKREADGDDHIQPTVDPEFSKLLNQRNKTAFLVWPQLRRESFNGLKIKALHATLRFSGKFFDPSSVDQNGVFFLQNLSFGSFLPNLGRFFGKTVYWVGSILARVQGDTLMASTLSYMAKWPRVNNGR